LSLLLCLAVAVLWVRSTDHMTSWVPRRLPQQGGGEIASGLCVVHGGVYAMTHHRKATKGGRPVRFLDREVGPPATPHFFGTPDHSLLGFEWNGAKSRWESADDPSYVRVPLWAVMVALAFFPLMGMARRVLTRQHPASCRKCRYDLTANVSGVCPECGTPRQ
jgi:hypothetical protein